MDLNHIFLFVAIVSPLLVLARGWRPGGIFRGWRIAAIIVLVITGASWLFFREYAGFVGGGAWFVLLFLPAVGLRKASQLAAQGRYKSARRIVSALQILHPTAQAREQLDSFRTLEARVRPEMQIPNQSPSSMFGRLRNAPAVITLILVNVAVFVVELHREALTNPIVLHRLGALDVAAVIGKGEFWRLFTALFLHNGLVHLVFNLFALYVLGPSLERTIGTLRFTACYLISGIASSAGVVALTVIKILRPAELVGASGCIMGVVGAWAGFLLRHRHVWQARQRLLNILLIIVIQIVFDIFTPEVSSSAHLCGLVAGFIVGLSVTPKRSSL